ncbi:endothelial cell-specific molecule 1 isoform X1 [Paramormyrops kingsleyae]|uniref:Endothelial cell-specific molecule 1 n=1 Tax=Paramormyrops kingsleyae TaxID=1676925 RepID=A0A3B3RX87_9TELE|nr:endothelial cell-specific molecule 1 isoform X1 [Paramormyrops kingsleyae]
MHVFIINIFLVLVLREVEPWGAGPKYPANCPSRCNVGLCGGAQRCKRTVLDDCNCCPVCAAARGEHCYRTVSGMHGVKCGPGLFCEFYKEEDDYGDEYGICKDCVYGKYGVECRETCKCKSGGICDRETGACLNFNFFAKIASKRASKLKEQPDSGTEMGSGDGTSNQNADLPKERPPGSKRLNPR